MNRSALINKLSWLFSASREQFRFTIIDYQLALKEPLIIRQKLFLKSFNHIRLASTVFKQAEKSYSGTLANYGINLNPQNTYTLKLYLDRTEVQLRLAYSLLQEEENSKSNIVTTKMLNVMRKLECLIKLFNQLKSAYFQALN